MQRLGRSLALFSSLWLAPAVARAQASGGATDETVRLRSGAVYSGHLVEKVPGDHVTLQLATGEIKVIPWADIPAAAAPSAPPAAAASVRVRLRAENPHVALYRLSSTFGGYDGDGDAFSGANYERVCLTPCDLRLDRASQYQIGGEGVAASDILELPAADRVELTVHAGSASLQALGWVFTYLGGGLALAAPLSLALEAAMPSGPAGNGGLTASPFFWPTVGAAALGVGLLAVGLPLWLGNGTKVSMRSSRSGDDLDSNPAPDVP